jgi:hypothetical protein
MNFSNTKKKRIDPTTVNEIPSVRPPSSASSGRMWISASPSNAPTASPTRRGRMRLREGLAGDEGEDPHEGDETHDQHGRQRADPNACPNGEHAAGGYPTVAMVRSNLWSFINVACCASLARDAPNGPA